MVSKNIMIYNNGEQELYKIMKVIAEYKSDTKLFPFMWKIEINVSSSHIVKLSLR